MSQQLRVDNPDNFLQQGALMESHTDVTGAAHVEVSNSKGVDGKQILWVNVNGICLLRICQIKELVKSGADDILERLESMQSPLSQIKRGTHDACPTRRYYGDNPRAMEVDAWWLAYHMSQQESHRELAEKCLELVSEALAALKR